MHRRFILAFSGIAMVSAELAGQATNSSIDRAPCSYDVCALRVEGREVLRGREGQPILRLGHFSATRLSPLIGISDSAQYYAAEFDRHYAAGTRWAALGDAGLGTLVYVLMYSEMRSSGNREDWGSGDWAWLGGFVLSLSISSYGNERRMRARHGLARAIWWHNRNLVPSP